VKGVILDPLIYNNGPIITSEGAGFEGADISEVQTSLEFYDYGYNSNTIFGYRCVDDITIPEGEEWLITGLGIYNWQTESDTNSTINHLDFRIFNGLPFEATSDILVDYYDINKLSGSKWSGVYRVPDFDKLNTDRPVMLSVANMNEDEQIVLTEGTYWLDFSSGGTMLSGPWIPFITHLDSLTTGNAWHLGNYGWQPWIQDTVYTQGMPFMLYGSKINDIKSIQKEDLTIYPNPGNGNFYFKSSQTGIAEVYGMDGQLLHCKVLKDDKSIDLTPLDSGIYFFVIRAEDEFYSAKIAIEP
jgi:hypothetical protein